MLLKLQQAIGNLPVIGHSPVHLAFQKIITSLEAVEYLKVYVVIQGIIKKYWKFISFSLILMVYLLLYSFIIAYIKFFVHWNHETYIIMTEIIKSIS